MFEIALEPDNSLREFQSLLLELHVSVSILSVNLKCQSQGGILFITNLNQLLLDLLAHNKSRFSGGEGVRGGPDPILYFLYQVYYKYIYHLQPKETALQCPLALVKLTRTPPHPPFLENDHLDSLLTKSYLVSSYKGKQRLLHIFLKDDSLKPTVTGSIQ